MDKVEPTLRSPSPPPPEDEEKPEEEVPQPPLPSTPPPTFDEEAELPAESPCHLGEDEDVFEGFCDAEEKAGGEVAKGGLGRRGGRTEKRFVPIPPAKNVETRQAKPEVVESMIPTIFALCDEVSEEKLFFKLKDVIARAKRGKVFAGKTFYVTLKVQADMQLVKNVIVSCGAQVRTSAI
jgi:hypothetical protein